MALCSSGHPCHRFRSIHPDEVPCSAFSAFLGFAVGTTTAAGTAQSGGSSSVPAPSVSKDVPNRFVVTAPIVFRTPMPLLLVVVIFCELFIKKLVLVLALSSTRVEVFEAVVGTKMPDGAALFVAAATAMVAWAALFVITFEFDKLLIW
jgi:energy-converting hydrogenase Eha subunit A